MIFLNTSKFGKHLKLGNLLFMYKSGYEYLTSFYSSQLVSAFPFWRKLSRWIPATVRAMLN